MIRSLEIRGNRTSNRCRISGSAPAVRQIDSALGSAQALLQSHKSFQINAAVPWPGIPGFGESRASPCYEEKFREAVILKISIFEWSRETRLLLEGKLAREWVMEAEKAWNAMDRSDGEKHLVVDLRGVSFVDHEGEQLLERFHAAGAILIGADPMIRGLIEEIKARRPQQFSAKNQFSLLTIVILSVLLAGLVVGCGLVY